MKVGLCGVGHRMGYLANMFSGLIKNFDLVAYTDPSPAGMNRVGADVARKLRAYEDIEEMLSAEQLDLVMIGSPNSFHYEQLCVALNTEVKIFCEKPIVITEEQTFGLLERLSERGPDQIIVGLVMRYAPLFVDLAKLVRSGALGDIVSVEASEHINPAHGAFFFRDWRRKSAMSGGFLLEKCCHDLDIYAAILQSRPRQVASFGGCSIFKPERSAKNHEQTYSSYPSGWGSIDNPFSGEADIVDHQVALIEYECGAKLCFHANIHTPDEFRRFCIIGTEGMAEGDFVRGTLKSYRAIPTECILDKTYQYDDASHHYGAEQKMADDLTRHLESGETLPVSVIDCLEAGLTALKIDEARKRGVVMDLSDMWSKFDALKSEPASKE